MKKKTKTSNIVVSGLLDYLSETGQTGLLPQVTAELQDLVKKPSEAKEIVITSFLPLTPQQQDTFGTTVQKLINMNLPLVTKIDKKLLGGFTISVGDWFLDASLARELRNLKQVLLS